MADIKNKNELKRRIELFMDELDYSINEKFCKETMLTMREFIGHASHRIDCLESKIKSLEKKLKEYRQLEEQGLLLRLPCREGNTVYRIEASVCKWREMDKCSRYCDGGRYVDCWEGKFVVREESFHLYLLNEIGKTVFPTREEAEQALAEMKGKEDEKP